jgi:hypothetical protein
MPYPSRFPTGSLAGARGHKGSERLTCRLRRRRR